jgi:hypothetical protein
VSKERATQIKERKRRQAAAKKAAENKRAAPGFQVGSGRGFASERAVPILLANLLSRG